MPATAISDKQLAANRANAARSTGPRTPEGKARSSQNSRKHGFTAVNFSVVRLEDHQEIASLRDDLIAFYQPTNSQQLFALERLAVAQQALLRCARFEAGLLTAGFNMAFDPEAPELPGICEQLSLGLEVTRQQNRNYAMAVGFHRMNREANSWLVFLRYQAQVERHYRRAVEDLDRIRTLCPAPNAPPNEQLPNEPISDAQPEQNEPGAPPQTNPSSNPPEPQFVQDESTTSQPESLESTTPPSNCPTPSQVSDSTREPGNPPQDSVEDSYGFSLQQNSTDGNDLKILQIKEPENLLNGLPCALPDSVERKATQ